VGECGIEPARFYGKARGAGGLKATHALPSRIRDCFGIRPSAFVLPPMPSRPIPADARRALLLYRLLFPVVFLALLPGVLLRMWRRGGAREKFAQRFGRYPPEDRARFASREWVWIHSISVGETLVALKLARELHAREPALGVLLSTTTTTGFAEARKAAGDWLEPIYNPLDARSIVRRALDALRPRQLILVEGEVWPNLVAECCERGIPVALAAARLSPRSERRFRRFRALVGPIFRLLERVCVAEPEDIARWQSLGVERERIVCTGSVKFDDTIAAPARTAEFRALLTTLGVAESAPILVAGSTWAPEEEVLTRALVELRREFPDLFLVLVPRHIERTDSILRALAPLGLCIARRSDFNIPNSTFNISPDLLLVDATGELRDWYSLATVAFVGKSLPGIAEVGGQNPAEPAGLGKPVLFGPHMENFAAVVALLLRREGATQIPDAEALADRMALLLRNAAQCSRLGENARTALDHHRGATGRTVDALKESGRPRPQDPTRARGRPTP
jgi:3-deoxy-D-manno-octulosonic-acid transferase